MRTARLRRTVSALAAGFVVSLIAAVPSHAQPIGDPSPAKDCKTPEGIVIKSGSTGTSGGKTYSCTNGIGCQVENGKVTDKCSHMALTRPPSGITTVVKTKALVLAR
jgi:hypothetical protein